MKVYVIHLPDAGRRAAMDAELARMDLRGEYLHAQPPGRTFTVPNMRRNPRVEFGIACSHIKAIVRALADGAGRALFLEDDIRFLVGPERLAEVVAELPEGWDVLYLGGHPREPTRRETRSLVKVGRFSFAEAYAMSRKALRPFVDYWLDRAGQPDAMIDLVLGEFAAAHNGYCAYPLLTEQRAVVSHVKGKMDVKSHLVAKGWTTHAPC